MRRTGIRFIWVTGSLSSNAIKVLKQRNIAFEYDHFGKLTAGFYGIGFLKRSISNTSRKMNSRFA